MNIIPTRIPDVKILEPKVFGDERGFFMETFRDEWFQANIAPHTLGFFGGERVFFADDSSLMISFGSLISVRPPRSR